MGRLQRILKSRRFWIAAGSGCFLLAAFLASQTRLIIQPLRAHLLSRLEAALPGHSARLGRIRTDFVRSFSLSDLEISAPGGFERGTLLRVETIKFTYRLIDLARMRWDPEKSLSRIEFVKPVLSVARTEQGWSGLRSGSRAGPARFFPAKFRVIDGRIEVSDPGGRLDGMRVSGLEGALDSASNPATFSLQAAVDGSSVQVQGEIKDLKALHLRLAAKDFALPGPFSRFAVLPASAALRSGSMELEVETAGPWPPPSGLSDGVARLAEGTYSLFGRLQLKAAQISLPLRGRFLDIRLDGAAKLDNQRVELEDLQARTAASRLKLTGSLLSPFGARDLRAQAEGSIALSDIAGPAGPSPLPGSLQISAVSSGPLLSPQADVSLRLAQAELQGQALSMDALLQVSSSAVAVRQFSAQAGKGRIAAQGLISAQALRGDVQATKFPLQMFWLLFKPANPPPMSGFISLKARASGQGSAPVLAGSVGISAFKWGAPPAQSLSGSLNYRSGSLKLRLSGRDRARLNLDASASPGHASLDRLEIALGAGESATARARLDRNSRAIQGSLQVGSLSVARLAPWLKFLGNFNGNFAFKGTLAGAWGAPLLQGRITAPGLTVQGKDGARAIGGLSSALLWEKGHVRLDPLTIAGQFKGWLDYRKRGGRLQIRSQISQGDPNLLFACLNLPQDIAGRLEGRLDFVHMRDPELAAGERVWSGRAALSVSGGHWSRIAFEKLDFRLSADERRVAVEEFSFKQKEGSLHLRVEAEQTAAENPLRLVLSAKRFKVAAAELDGEGGGEGAYAPLAQRLSAAVRLQPFAVNRFSAGELTGRVAYADKTLSVDDLAWGSFFKGQLRLAGGKGGAAQLEGEWSSQEKTLEDWHAMFRSPQPLLTGRMTLSGKVSGTVSDPQLSLRSGFNGLKLAARPGGDAFSGEGSASLARGMVQSLSVRLQTPQGGRLSLLGQVGLDSRQLSLESSFDSVQAASLLPGDVPIESPASGRLTIHGDWKAPVAKGEIAGGAGRLGKIELDAWEASGSFQEKEFLFSRLVFRGKRGSWRFSLMEDSWVRPSADQRRGSYRLAADFANVPLGPVSLVGNGVVEGSWAPSAKDPSHLTFSGKARLNEGSANDFEFQPFQVGYSYSERAIEFLPAGSNLVRGGMDFSRPPCVRFDRLTVSDRSRDAFSMDGDWCPDQPDFTMQGLGLDAGFLAGLFAIPGDVAGPADFKIRASVQGGSPALSGALSVRDGRIADIPVQDFTAVFNWKEGMLHLGPLEAKNKDYFSVRATGSIPMKWGGTPASRSDMSLSVHCPEANLSVLNFLKSRNLRNVAGSMSADVSVKGKPAAPRIDGSVRIRNGEFDFRYLNRRAKNFDADIQVHGNKVSVRGFALEAGGDRLRLEGSLLCRLEDGDFVLDDFNLKAANQGKKGIPIQVPELPAVRESLGIPSSPSKGSPRFSLQMTGKREKPKISGWVILEDTLFSYPPPKRRERGAAALSDVEWDVELKTGKHTIFQNDYAYAKINGRIRLQGEPGDMTVTGKVASNEGTINIFGARFELRDAALEVVQPREFAVLEASAPGKNVAYLQFRAEQSAFVDTAEGKLPDTISLQLERTPLTGEFDPQKLTFRSALNPNLPSERVAARAGLGVNLETLDQQERDLQMRQGIARLLDSQLATRLSRTVLQRAGIVDKIEFSQDSKATRSAEARGQEPSFIDPLIGQSILLERTFGAKLGVGYKATFDRIQDKADLIHRIQLRYPFYKNIWLYGSTELDSRENLGRDPEREAGFRTQFKFDPSDWFKKKEPSPAPSNP